jgi:hypothetical protein
MAKKINFERYSVQLNRSLSLKVDSVDTPTILDTTHLVVLTNTADLTVPVPTDVTGQVYIIRNTGASVISIRDTSIPNPNVLFTVPSGDTEYLISSGSAWVSLKPL